jgi:hypothetical protein
VLITTQGLATQSDRPRDQTRFARQLEKVVKATSLADDDDTWLQGVANIEDAGTQTPC